MYLGHQDDRRKLKYFTRAYLALGFSQGFLLASHTLLAPDKACEKDIYLSKTQASVSCVLPRFKGMTQSHTLRSAMQSKYVTTKSVPLRP